MCSKYTMYDNLFTVSLCGYKSSTNYYSISLWYIHVDEDSPDDLTREHSRYILYIITKCFLCADIVYWQIL